MLQRLANRPLVRRAADALFVLQGRRRVGKLDRCPLERIQRNLLLQLVRNAQHTRFGRLHDFSSIHTIADYQARVPLRDYEAFWKGYWQADFPHLRNVTWPGDIPYFALSSGTTSGTTKYIPISHEMLISNRRAGLTTLALQQAHYSDLKLFCGRMFFLGGSTDFQQLSRPNDPRGQVLAGDLSGIAVREVSSILRAYTFPPLKLALLRDWEQKMKLLAEHSLGQPISLFSGVPSWMLVLFDHLKKLSGKERIIDIWPSLRLIVHGGTKFDPYRALFQRLIGSDDVKFAETYAASEGFIAAEDPRYNLLRLIPDHSLFYEFVPVEELDKDRPTRHTASEVVPGVQYAVVVTTCAGLWSYVIGDTVCFERREPPLFRFTGRTRYFLSAFGEHLISDEIERAVTTAAQQTQATVVDFHVGPLFPENPGTPGRHRYLIEFADRPSDLPAFIRALDASLCQLNEDYQAHRVGDLTMLQPEVCCVRKGGFAEWMRSRGKLGGQHKVPRMDNSGEITRAMSAWLNERRLLALPSEVSNAG